MNENKTAITKMREWLKNEDALVEEKPLAPKPEAKTDEGLNIFGSGKIDPLRHSEKCPASKGGPICTCGGNYGV